MELTLTKDTFAFKTVTNPFRKIVSESGLFLGDGSLYQSEETGRMEKLSLFIGFGIVTIVGPDCKTIKVGDGIFFNVNTPEPIPFEEPVWIMHEGTIRAIVKNDGTLQAKIDAFEATLRQETLKNTLAMSGGVATAGQPGSGLKLV